VAFRLEAPRSTEDGLMLGRPRHDRSTFRNAVSDPEEREVDCLSARAGEGDLRAVRAKRLRGQVASSIQSGAGGSTFAVRAGWIAFGEVAERRSNFWKDRR